MLINAFSLDATLYSNLKVSISNFWTGDAALAARMEGDKLPTILKI